MLVGGPTKILAATISCEGRLVVSMLSILLYMCGTFQPITSPSCESSFTPTFRLIRSTVESAGINNKVHTRYNFFVPLNSV